MKHTLIALKAAKTGLLLASLNMMERSGDWDKYNVGDYYKLQLWSDVKMGFYLSPAPRESGESGSNVGGGRSRCLVTRPPKLLLIWFYSWT